MRREIMELHNEVSRYRNSALVLVQWVLADIVDFCQMYAYNMHKLMNSNTYRYTTILSMFAT